MLLGKYGATPIIYPAMIAAFFYGPKYTVHSSDCGTLNENCLIYTPLNGWDDYAITYSASPA